FDELAIYNEALTTKEIGTHYSYSKGGEDYCYKPETSSSTEREYTVAGCDLNGGSLLMGECSSSGEWYCAGDGELWNTFEDDKACSYNQTLEQAGVTCCPEAYKCDEEDNKIICVPREYDCSDWEEKGDCLDDGCIWAGEQCYDPNSAALSCSIYEREESCEEDVWNLGRQGAGTHVCGMIIDENRMIKPESCRCSWYEEECHFNYTIQEAFYEKEQNPINFQCLKQFNVSECIDGKQDVEWTAQPVNYDISPKLEDLEKADCVNGSTTKLCGEPIVKLPGFSLFNVIAVLLLLGIFYLFKQKY
ncbi:MAG: hypothetical protein ACP5D2_01290, partial [Candidatus Nanoarchaeia archaeon]